MNAGDWQGIRGKGLILFFLGLMLACPCQQLLSRAPTPTPTKTPTPPYTLTFTPTYTSTPTFTPLPTPTNPLPTPTPIPPTPTPLPPSPTPKPKPKPTPAPPPTPTPPPPPPTAPPQPTHQYTIRVVTGFPNCGSTGVFGTLKDGYGNLIRDVWIRLWRDGWDGVWFHSRGKYIGALNDRNWEYKLRDGPLEGQWHIAVVEGKESKNYLSEVVDVTTTSHCQGEGAVQWPMLEIIKNW